MKSNALVVFAMVAAALAVVGPAICQEDMTVVDNAGFTNPQRPVSVFVHDTHNEKAAIEECNECHHVYKDGKKVDGESSEDQRCAECHTLSAEGSRPGLRRAFHLNCIGCHDAKKKGPVICGQCHVNK